MSAISELVQLDSNIIPDEKERLFKESLELFRRAINLNDALATINNALQYVIKDEKIKMIYNLSSMTLQKDRDEVLQTAVTKYIKSKE